jgi:hypothetical protein
MPIIGSDFTVNPLKWESGAPFQGVKASTRSTPVSGLRSAPSIILLPVVLRVHGALGVLRSTESTQYSEYGVRS